MWVVFVLGCVRSSLCCFQKKCAVICFHCIIVPVSLCVVFVSLCLCVLVVLCAVFFICVLCFVLFVCMCHLCSDLFHFLTVGSYFFICAFMFCFRLSSTCVSELLLLFGPLLCSCFVLFLLLHLYTVALSLVVIRIVIMLLRFV